MCLPSYCGQTPRWDRACARCRFISIFSTKTSPPFLDGWMSPRIREIVVDFPAPLGPNSAKTSPLLIPNVIFSTAVLVPNDLVRFRTRRPSFELSTRASSSFISSSVATSAGRAMNGDPRRRRYHARIDPLSYQRRTAKRTNAWMMRYRIGPPYCNIPPG